MNDERRKVREGVVFIVIIVGVYVEVWNFLVVDAGICVFVVIVFVVVVYGYC